MKNLAFIFSLFLFASAANAAEYDIDVAHSTVGFKIKHLAISTVLGRFTDFSGRFSYDPANVKASTVDAKIEVESINTDQTKRDEHLKSPEFFDESKFHEMTFVSKEINNVSATGFKVIGDLRIRDITKPVVLDVTIGGLVKDPWGKERAAFSATTKINRRDFGLIYNKVLETGGLLVGDEVNISLEIEGVKKG